MGCFDFAEHSSVSMLSIWRMLYIGIYIYIDIVFGVGANVFVGRNVTKDNEK